MSAHPPRDTGMMRSGDVLVAVVSSEEMTQTGDLIEAALSAPEDQRAEAIRELMRYARGVLRIPEPEAPC